MEKKFSKVFLILYNETLLVQDALSPLRSGLYEGEDKYSKLSVEIDFQYPIGLEFDGRKIIHILGKVWESMFQFQIFSI